MKRAFLSLVMASALLFSARTHAQVFVGQTKVSDRSAGSIEREPMIHFGPKGDLYAVWFEDQNNIRCSRSIDGGNSFLPSVLVSTGVSTATLNMLLQRAPHFVVDPQGVLHLVWKETRIKNQDDIWYVRSSDHGATWTAPVSIIDADDSSKYPQDFCSIACDSSGNLYVGYLDYRGTTRGTDDRPQVFLSRSIDGGATWEKHVHANVMKSVTSGACECCKLDIAAGKAGNVYIAFRSNIDTTGTNYRDMYIARSRDKGVTFDPAIDAQQHGWEIQGCPSTGPSIGLDAQENLSIVWIDGAGGDQVLYTRLPFGADATIPTVALTTPDDGAKYPAIAVNRDGGVVMLYQPLADEPLHYRYSPRGDTNWTPSNFIVQSPITAQIFGSAEFNPTTNDLWATWQDARSDEGDVFIAHAPLTALRVTTVSDRNNQLSVWPNPVRQDRGFVSVALSGKESSLITVYDQLGRSVVSLHGLKDISIPTKSLAPGVYSIRLQNAVTASAHFVVE